MGSNSNVVIGGGSATQRLTITNGNIMVNSPSTNNAANGIRINRPSSSYYAGQEFATGGVVDWAIGVNSSGLGIFENGQASTTRMNFTDGGSIGINTTSPDSNSQIEIETTKTRGLLIDQNATGTSECIKLDSTNAGAIHYAGACTVGSAVGGTEGDKILVYTDGFTRYQATYTT